MGQMKEEVSNQDVSWNKENPPKKTQHRFMSSKKFAQNDEQKCHSNCTSQIQNLVA